MPSDEGKIQISEIDGAILRINSLSCEVPEGDVHADLVYMRMLIDGKVEVPFPLSGAALQLLGNSAIVGLASLAISDDLQYWEMSEGSMEPIALPIPFTKSVQFRLFDHDGGLPGDKDDKLGVKLVSVKMRGATPLHFKGDEAHYILNTEVVSPADATLDEIFMLLEALGIDPALVEGLLPKEPGKDDGGKGGDNVVGNAIATALGAAGLGSSQQPLTHRDPAYAGVWRARGEGERLVDGLDFTSFAARTGELSDKGMRLVGVEPHVDAGKRLWSGFFAPGDDAYAFHVTDQKTFLAKHDELTKAGLRLVDLSTYEDDGRRWWAGVWRAGTDGHAILIGLEWAAFAKAAGELAGKGVRLSGLQTYKDGHRRLWAGFFRAGNDGHALWSGDWDGFVKVWDDLAKKGLRLVDVATFQDGRRRGWAGVWREGGDAHLLLAGLSEKDFLARHAEARKQGLRLADMEIYQPA